MKEFFSDDLERGALYAGRRSRGGDQHRALPHQPQPLLDARASRLQTLRSSWYSRHKTQAISNFVLITGEVGEMSAWHFLRSASSSKGQEDLS